MKFRKRPIVIEAVQFLLSEYADPLTFNEVPDWLSEALNSKVIRGDFRGEDYWYLVIKTLEGDMTAEPNDYIIKGVKNELYPCKLGIFRLSYEAVNED